MVLVKQIRKMTNYCLLPNPVIRYGNGTYPVTFYKLQINKYENYTKSYPLFIN